MYQYEGVDKATYNKVASLMVRWNELRAEANWIDDSMQAVKQDFSEVTTREVKDFHATVKQAYKEYMANGPGAPETNLKDGDISLLAYKQEIMKLNKQREELVHAQ